VDEHVGLADRAAGVVDEARLRRLPLVGVALAGALVERLDVELLAPLPALGELRLRLPLRRRVRDRPVVLGAEALSERPRPRSAERIPEDEREHHYRRDRDDDPDPGCHCQTSFLLWLMGSRAARTGNGVARLDVRS